ncbi:MAG: 2-phosphosulfolactate phosphatase [Gemmatimonadales bacterium]|nr:2-phosphosulfolactate phosphatase [Gemmatimonadales bacterium]
MKLDVVFTPQGLVPADVAGRTVFVIDVLRATTAMCAALAHGAKAVIPVASSEEAVRLAQTLGSADVLLAGERNCARIEGFALGNSPLEMTEEVVKGKSLIMATTNGTKAMLVASGATAIYAASAANLTIAGERARDALERHRDILIICAGRDGAFSLDDAYTAGRLAVSALGGRKPRKGLNDAALAALDLVRRYGDHWFRPLAYSRAGRELIRLGYRADVEDASRMDRYPVLPHLHERRVTLAPAAA